MAYAMKVAKHEDVAEELVQWAFMAILEADPDWVDGEVIWYMCHMVSLRFLNVARGKSKLSLQRRGGVNMDDVFGEIQRLVTRPNQEECAEVAAVFRALDHLPAEEAHALRLVAVGYEQVEIANILGVTRRIAIGRIDRGREKLLKLTGHNRQTQPNKSGFRGVRKSCNKWVATHSTKAGGVNYLGLFDTAEEAALAFDMAALARLGDRATLNFPELRDELMQKLAA